MSSVARFTATIAAFALFAASLSVGAPVALAAPSQPKTREPAPLTAIDTPRVAGANRYATAAAVSQQWFPDGAATVFVATGTNFPDSLAAGPAARAANAPILLTRPGDVPAATADEIARLGPDRIVVVGGSVAVSGSVFAELDAMAASGATRIGGANRYETAALLVATYFDPSIPVFVATGEAFPDGLSAGAAAAAVDGALLLVEQNHVPAATAEQLQRLDRSIIYVAGLTQAVSAAVESLVASYGPTARLGGEDRWATSAAISAEIYPNGSPYAFVATGELFPDALSIAPVAGRLDGPLLLVPRWWLPAVISSELARVDPDTAFIIGGEVAISAGVENAIAGITPSVGCSAGNKVADAGQQLYQSIPGAAGQVALTFDMNGPLAPQVGMIEYLVDAGVCATIFAAGERSQTAGGRAVLELIAANPGQLEVGNHTMHHCDLAEGTTGDPDCPTGPASAQFVMDELWQAAAVIEDISGLSPAPYWRPPYAEYTSFILDAAADAGYTKTFMWSIDTRDWEAEADGGPTTAEMVDQVVSQATSGSIVLFHTGGYNTPEAIPQIVAGLRDRGFVLTSLSDMLND